MMLAWLAALMSFGFFGLAVRNTDGVYLVLAFVYAWITWTEQRAAFRREDTEERLKQL